MRNTLIPSVLLYVFFAYYVQSFSKKYYFAFFCDKKNCYRRFLEYNLFNKKDVGIKKVETKLNNYSCFPSNTFNNSYCSLFPQS